MAEDKKSEDGEKQATPAGAEANPPATDALGKPNEDGSGGGTAPSNGSMDLSAAAVEGKPAKKLSPVKKITRHLNIYLLLFVFVLVIGAVIVIVSYMNSKKAPITPTVASQTLTQSELKQLANSDATVGGSGQTLNVQGNTVFSGQVLIRSNLNVAGTIQLGGNLNVAQLTVANSSNLANTQTNTLQVSGTSVFQGVVTIQNGMNVTGSTSINSATIGTLTASKIIMSGNAQLQIPNHIGFSGSSAPHLSSQSGLGGGNASIIGSDTSGTVTVNTGDSPQTGCMVGLTFAQAFYSTKPNVIISLESSTPINVEYYAGNLSTSGFSICSANTPPAHQQFAFSYFITASSAQ